MFRTLCSLVAVIGLLAVHPLAQGARPNVATRGVAKTTGPLNLNSATAAELENLPGIGAKTAVRIIEYRQKKGPFKKIEELMNVQGIGEKSFLKLKSQITVASTPAAAAPRQ